MQEQEALQEQLKRVGWLLLQKHRLHPLLKQLEGPQEDNQPLLTQGQRLGDHQHHLVLAEEVEHL